MKTSNLLVLLSSFLMLPYKYAHAVESKDHYDEYVYATKDEMGHEIFKAQCYNGKRDVCSLSSVSVVTDKHKHSGCGIYSSEKLNVANATRRKDGSWQVIYNLAACREVKTYTFSSTGMVVIHTSPSKFTKEETEDGCKSFPPKTSEAKSVNENSVKDISIGNCKTMSVHMFMGDIVDL